MMTSQRPTRKRQGERSLRLRRLAWFALVLASMAGPAGAVLIEAGGPRTNKQAPSPDPGWAHVGVGNGLTVVYLGEGWVLSAAHVGEVKVAIDGGVYHPIPGSHSVLTHAGTKPSDVALFRIDPYPAKLPKLPLRETPVAVGELALLVGHGRDRGPALGWPKPTGRDGFRWAKTKGKRWGTNLVAAAGLDIDAWNKRTRSFATEFDRAGTSYEAQATPGDSGGPAFIRGPGGYALAGIIWGSTGLPGQPPETTLYGSRTFISDVSFYRDQIVGIMTPACGNGHITIDEECDDGNRVDGDCCSQACTIETPGAACDDGLYCNGPDRCSERGQCVPTDVNPCDDGDACTEDICREPATCEHPPSEAPACRAAGAAP